MSFNQATIVGNLGNDPKVTRTQAGKPIVSFSVATSEKWKEETKTTWHNVVVFSEGLCGIAEKFLKKGSKVLIQGKIVNDSYEKDGQKIYRSQIVLGGFNSTLTMLDGANGQGSGNQGASGGNYGQASQGGQSSQGGGFSNDMDDDIPF
jgi:single-strand DNA-binding protein